MARTQVWYRIKIDDQEEFGRGMEFTEVPPLEEIPQIFELLAKAAKADLKVKHG